MKISFREFIKILMRFSESAYPKQDRPSRLARLFLHMEGAGNLARVGETGTFSFDGVAVDLPPPPTAAPAPARRPKDEYRSPTPPPPAAQRRRPGVPSQRPSSPARTHMAMAPYQTQLMLPAPPASGSVTDPSMIRLLEELYATINYADKRCFVLDGQVERANDQLVKMRKKLRDGLPAKAVYERHIAELEAEGRRDKGEVAALKGEVRELKRHIKEVSGDQRAGAQSVADLEHQVGGARPLLCTQYPLPRISPEPNLIVASTPYPASPSPLLPP